MGEIAFESWVKHCLPLIELEDWCSPNVHRRKKLHPEYANLIDEWGKREITAIPDYLLRFKGRPILWVDVKDTKQPIRNPFNLNAAKYDNYLSVSYDTGIPASIVVFQMEESTPRMWGYVLPEQYNHIPLSDISTFESELRRLSEEKLNAH